MEAIDNLSTVLDITVSRLGHAARALLWLVAALVCAMVASVLGMTALLVSLWDRQQVLALVAPGITFAILAAVFGVVAARALHAQRAPAAVSSGTLTTWQPPASPGAPDARPTPGWRLRPLTWIVALLSLLFLGGSRELLALALRFRAVLALLAHALHVLQLFSRRRGARLLGS
jgi:tellurite resistance protein TehA-like permease